MKPIYIVYATSPEEKWIIGVYSSQSLANQRALLAESRKEDACVFFHIDMHYLQEYVA